MNGQEARGAGIRARRLGTAAGGAADGAVVAGVLPGSLGEALGLERGDRILAIDGRPPADYVDYRFQCAGDEISVLVRKADGRELLFSVQKDYDADLGVMFASDLFDGLRRCRNACLFCFLHQMPEGLRPSLYVPDDDYRLSFLHGNFITLTNLGEADLERIIAQRLSPLYVSVHATNPELRVKLMRNRRAGRIMDQLRRLAAAGIEIHAQLVLCPGINDGAELDRSVGDLAALHPSVRSIAAVPVGLTRYRAGLPALRPFTAEEAARVIDQVEGWQRRLRRQLGSRLVHAADEFYVLAGRPVPPAAVYEGFPQLENGVGLVRTFQDGFRRELRRRRSAVRRARVTVITGRSAAPLLSRLAAEAAAAGVAARVVAVANEFFGPHVTVAGLLTGSDIARTLAALRDQGWQPGEEVLLPGAAVRPEEGDFLDGWRPPDVARAAGVPVRVVPPDGASLARHLLGIAV